MKLTTAQLDWLAYAWNIAGWFEPRGPGWGSCDALTKRGLLEHNGAPRGAGERYRITEAGKKTLTDPTSPAVLARIEVTP